MKGKGLTQEVIIEAAVRLTQEKGYGNFSLRDLAQCLHVRAASLYNHINGAEDITRGVGETASLSLGDALENARSGKERDEAVRAIAYAYRDWARENPELYRAILGLPSMDSDSDLGEIGRQSFRAINKAIHRYDIERSAQIHVSRCLRSSLHGFLLMQNGGYFSNADYAAEDTFRFLVESYIAQLHHLEEERRISAPPENPVS